LVFLKHEVQQVSIGLSFFFRQIAGDYLRGKAKLLREGGSGHGGVAEWGEVAQHINSRAQMAYIGKKTVISV